MAYATLAQLRAELGFKTANTGDDTLLTAKLDRATAIIDGATQRVFNAVTMTRYYDAVRDVDDMTLHLDYDLLSITTLINGDGVVVPAAARVLLPANYTPKFAVKLKASYGYYWTYDTDPEDAISIEGSWGYMATPSADIVEATLLIAAYLYRLKDEAEFGSAGVADVATLKTLSAFPKRAMDIICHYARMI